MNNLPPDVDEEAKKKIRTKQELHLAKKKEAEESAIYFETVDGPGGAKYIEQIESDKVKKSELTRYEILSAIDAHKHQFSLYTAMLSEYGQRLLNKIDWSPDWKYDCIPTKAKTAIRIYGHYFKGQRGVLFVVKSPSGKVFCRGMKVWGFTEIDVNAVEILAEQAENTLDSYRGILLDKSNKNKMSPGGIILNGN
jgi:hypothetical protein